MVVAGALTMLVLYYLTRRTAGGFAVLLAAALLVTDPTFILTNTFDRGTVVLDNCCSCQAVGSWCVTEGHPIAATDATWPWLSSASACRRGAVFG